MTLSNDGLVAFHYKSCGIFCIQSKSPITSVEDFTHYSLIEPFILYPDEKVLIMFTSQSLVIIKNTKKEIL